MKGDLDFIQDRMWDIIGFRKDCDMISHTFLKIFWDIMWKVGHMVAKCQI